jgi:hypothetical protein
MPPRTYRFPSLITRFLWLSLAAVALAMLRPGARPSAHAKRRPRRRSGIRRVAVSLTFATLFFAGASFSAGAGDLVVDLVEQQATAEQAAVDASAAEDPDCTGPRGKTGDGEDLADGWDCPTEEPTDQPAEAAAPEATADPAAGDPATTEPSTTEPSTTEPAAPTNTAEESTGSAAADLVEQTAADEAAVASAGSAAPAAAAPSLSNAVRNEAAKPQVRRPAPKDDGAPPVLKQDTQQYTSAGKREPELDDPNTAATIWLQRAMPDPTPPSKRLTKRFSRNLTHASNKHRVHWSLVLGVLRARGYRGSVPATKVALNRLAGNLARLGARRDQWSAVLALEGRTAFADRTVALARYHRAVGLRALVRGLEWARPTLTKRLLKDKRVSIYSGGRADLHAGKIDVRVIVLIRFLAEAHGQVTVSSLESGHRLFSRPGVVSAHIYGLAVDVAALGGQTITGSNQLPGSVTEQAVRNMLLLPAEVRPVQVISLLGLGGPSFPMANHDDHIHAGF